MRPDPFSLGHKLEIRVPAENGMEEDDVGFLFPL